MNVLIPLGRDYVESAAFVVPPSHKATVLLVSPPGHAAHTARATIQQQQANGTSYTTVAVLTGGMEENRYTLDAPGVYRVARHASMQPSGVDYDVGTDNAGATIPDGAPVGSTRSALYGWQSPDFVRLLARDTRLVAEVDTRDISTGNLVPNLRSANERLVVRLDGEAFAAAQTFQVAATDTATGLPTFTADYVDIFNDTGKTIGVTRAGSPAEARMPPATTHRFVLPSRQLSSLTVRNATDNASINVSGDAVRRSV